MFTRYKNPLPTVFCTGLIVLAATARVYAQEEIPDTAEQKSDSNFRDQVRAAFQQDTPTVNDADLTEEFLTRTHEGDKLDLDSNIPEQGLRDEGPRIAVKAFRFHRLQEYPEYGIERAKIEQLAENLRVQFMKENQLLASGYSTENLEELAALLESMKAQDDPRSIGQLQLRQLINMIEQQNAERGITYADLEEIADALTGYYRSQGLFLAQVQIPAQDVEGGIITLTVQEGLLGQVAVEDNNKYSADQLASVFTGQKGKLVSHKKMEEGLYLLNDLPSLNVTGYFSAGDNPGETRLNLKVRDEKAWSSALRFDNHGSIFTGDQRMYTSVEWLNPTGIGDALRINYLRSSNAENLNSNFGSNLGQLRYSLPLFGARTRLEFSMGHNLFKVHDLTDPDNPVNRLELNGFNTNYALTVDHKFKRSRNFNITSSLGLTNKKTETGSRNNFIDAFFKSNEHVYGGEFGFYIDKLSSGSIPMLNILNVNLQYGKHATYNKSIDDAQGFRGSAFAKFSANTSSLMFVLMPFAEASSRIILTSRWQYSRKSLPGFEQLPLGGANGVRAFSVRDFSSDMAGFLSAEWYLKLPEAINPTIFGNRLNDILQIAFIADGGYGVLNNNKTLSEKDWGALSGAGLLFKISWEEAFASQISVAWPTLSKSSIEGTGDSPDTPAVYADFSFFFD